MRKFVLVVPALAALAVAGCSSESTSPQPSESSMVKDSPSATAPEPAMTEESEPAMTEESEPAKTEPSESVMAKGGQYVSESKYRADKAAYEDGNTVLFFYAAWCPDCQQTDKSIQQTGVPEDINIVKVDYDNANDLRKKYGVTQQHTFVLVGPGGEQIKKWTGTFTADDINAKAT
ncbi:MAG: thioredoxin family protein [Candidatus Nanopelagicales bacterium]